MVRMYKYPTAHLPLASPACINSTRRLLSEVEVSCEPHLQGVSTEDILMQGGDQALRQVLDPFLRFLTAPLHAAGNSLQRFC